MRYTPKEYVSVKTHEAPPALVRSFVLIGWKIRSRNFTFLQMSLKQDIEQKRPSPHLFLAATTIKVTF
ncbi:hypothetical protein CIPAW_11G124000 [Carya illinoinensis]|uniref:Uncharacterized protein n=1 Tax=Carya illinoinensis TaxID=32201 RepID=A0A8T1P6Y7_CARIL|nr:hypothetical protein CIPAW_11G124000 [Carya illinoinensis]